MNGASLSCVERRLPILEWLRICTICERKRLVREYACCEDCYFDKTEDGRALLAHVSYDEWAARPMVRMLLAVRHGQWVDAETIGDQLGIYNARDEWKIGSGGVVNPQQGERNALSTLVRRAIREGYLVRRAPTHSRLPSAIASRNGIPFEYRITPAGRSKATYRVDLQEAA